MWCSWPVKSELVTSRKVVLRHFNTLLLKVGLRSCSLSFAAVTSCTRVVQEQLRHGQLCNMTWSPACSSACCATKMLLRSTNGYLKRAADGKPCLPGWQTQMHSTWTRKGVPTECDGVRRSPRCAASADSSIQARASPACITCLHLHVNSPKHSPV